MTYPPHPTHEVDIERPQDSSNTGTDAYTSTAGYTTVESGVPARFSRRESFVRADGERVQRSPTLVVAGDVDIQIGDRVTVNIAEYEVRETSEIQDDRREATVGIRADLERAD
jgi:hypothetical protein